MENLPQQDNSTEINKKPGLPSPPRVKCPKGMKLPRSVKAQAALMKGRTKEFKKAWMRAMGIAIHEAAAKVKSAARTETNRQRSASTSTPAARSTTGNSSVDHTTE
jgi:hypothetical protein